jgi:broad specificity phosphatase PhoE
MRVLLLRHAETSDPAVFHGAESDVGLSERGRRQAAAVAPLLAAFRPRRLVSSAMRRARETAEPIARACGLEVHLEPALHERRVGGLSGTPTHGNGVWPETLDRWQAGDTAHAPFGAESYNDLCTRLLPVWERVTARRDGGPLVVVAHGIVCKVLLLNLLAGYSVADWHRIGPIHNTAITELVAHADGWHAVRINDLAPEVLRASAAASDD